MGTTFIRAFKDSDKADAEVGFRKTQGFDVVRIGPTDRIQLDGESPSSILWESGGDKDWIVIVATKDGVVT